MTPRQLAFAAQYALDHNGAAAAIRAGYASKAARQTASELLTKPNIRALVAEDEEAAAKRLGVTKERVIVELQAAIDVARQKADPMAMIRGWAEIGKLIGAYAPERRKIEISADAEALQAKFAAMSDAELLAIVERRAES